MILTMPGQVEADELAAELGCEVIPHPLRAGVVEAREPAPGIWLLSGKPAEVRAEVRAAMLRDFLACLPVRVPRAANMTRRVKGPCSASSGTWPTGTGSTTRYG